MSEGAKRKTGLTANAVKHARPRNKDYKLSDRDGLYLLVKTTGIRYWRMNYRFGGHQRTLSFGRWPEILLGDAREMLIEARRQLAKGLDPLEQAKLEKIAKSISATNTFQAVALAIEPIEVDQSWSLKFVCRNVGFRQKRPREHREADRQQSAPIAVVRLQVLAARKLPCASKAEVPKAAGSRRRNRSSHFPELQSVPKANSVRSVY